MCKILTALSENDITLSLCYHSTEDLATGWEIKEIIDHPEFFDSFYTNYPLTKVETMNDFIVYLFSLKFKMLSEMIPLLLQDDHKESIALLSEKADHVCAAIDKGDIIRFINSHIEDIFALKNHFHDIGDATLNLIKQYSSGIKSHVYSYLCTNYFWLIIDNFDAFYKIVKADPSLFETLFPTGHLSDLQERGFKRTLGVFATILLGNHEALKERVNDRIAVLIGDVETLAISTSEEDVMMNETVVREFTSFLQRIKHPKANDFTILYKNVEKVLFEWIHNNGSHAEYEIPVEEIIREFTSIENWMVRLLSLTHTYRSEDTPPTLKSRLDFEPKGVLELMDHCSTNLPTDDYFTRSHQMVLEVPASIGAGTMVGIMSRPEVYEDYAKLIMSALTFISQQMQRDDEHLRDDWALLNQMLQIIIANREAGTEPLQPLCYSAAMFTCSLMEKILRLLYIDRVKDTLYIPIEKATLGHLLTENNAEIVSVFGLAHTKHLAFFMLKYGDKKIGKNYRNRLAHWTEMTNASLTVFLVAEILWLFTDVVNTTFWYYIKQLRQSKETEDSQQPDSHNS